MNDTQVINVVGLILTSCNDTSTGVGGRTLCGGGAGDYRGDGDYPGDYHPMLPAALRITLIVLLPIVFTIGVIGNSLVIWIFCR